MSHHRLPVLGSSDSAAREVPPIPDENRRHALARPTVAITSAQDIGPAVTFAELLKSELSKFVPAELLRVREDAPAIDALESSTDWLITVGFGVPAYYRPRLHILLTHGLPPSAWSPQARALRDRVDVFLSDPRPAFAKELATALRAEPAAKAPR